MLMSTIDIIDSFKYRLLSILNVDSIDSSIMVYKNTNSFATVVSNKPVKLESVWCIPCGFEKGRLVHIYSRRLYSVCGLFIFRTELKNKEAELTVDVVIKCRLSVINFHSVIIIWRPSFIRVYYLIKCEALWQIINYYVAHSYSTKWESQ